MKLKIEVIGSGAISFRSNATLVQSRKADDIAVMRKVIEAGDAVDSDNGAQDGDVDVKGSVRYLFFKENLTGRVYLEPEDGDEA